jgi:hypothetical protein
MKLGEHEVELPDPSKARSPFDLMRCYRPDELKSMAIALFRGNEGKPVPEDDLRLFLWRCHVTRLDPWLGHIIPIYRGGKLTIQTSVEGYRCAAMRTGELLSIGEPVFAMENNKPVSCRVVVTRVGPGGREMTFPFTAHLAEFAVKNNGIWNEKPLHMLALRAEGHALRRAFPDALSGLEIGGDYDDEDERPRARRAAREEPEEEVVQVATRSIPAPVKVGGA